MIKKMSKIEARSTALSMRGTGWPGARVVAMDDGSAVITTHGQGCKCNMCPVLREDGFIS